MYDKIILERLKLGLRQHIPAAVLDSVELSAFADHLADCIALELRAYIYGERVERVQEVSRHTVWFETPATWWDHFKATHPGRWFLRWAKPPAVRYEHKNVTAEFSADIWRTYPDSTVVLPKELGASVVIPVTRTEWREE